MGFLTGGNAPATPQVQKIATPNVNDARNVAEQEGKKRRKAIDNSNTNLANTDNTSYNQFLGG